MYVPKHMKDVIEKILQVLKENRTVVSWTPNQKFVYDDQTVKNCSAVDLLDHMIRNSKSCKVNVPKEFVKALNRINLPSIYIKNKHFLNVQVGKSLPKRNVKSKDIVKSEHVTR